MNDIMAYYYRADLSKYTSAIYPITKMINSVDELRAYYTNNKDKYQFQTRRRGESSMAEAVFGDRSSFNDTFFEYKSLLLILLEETSGSVRHRVDDVSAEKNSLSVNITRILPEIGTMDMAQWHIVLELEKAWSAMDVAVIVSDEQLADR